jgi:hypothetical protein
VGEPFLFGDHDSADGLLTESFRIVYHKLGINWATSLLGFISLALLPVPWVFFKYGKRIRAMSHYETPTY